MKEKRLTNTDRTIQMIPVRKQTELEQVEHGMSDRVVCALHSEWFDPETGIPYYLTFSWELLFPGSDLETELFIQYR